MKAIEEPLTGYETFIRRTAEQPIAITLNLSDKSLAPDDKRPMNPRGINYSIDLPTVEARDTLLKKLDEKSFTLGKLGEPTRSRRGLPFALNVNRVCPAPISGTAQTNGFGGLRPPQCGVSRGHSGR